MAKPIRTKKNYFWKDLQYKLATLKSKAKMFELLQLTNEVKNVALSTTIN